MKKIVGTPEIAPGMGDVLLLTAVCKHIPDITVELFPNAEKYKIFFDNICKEVKIKDNAFVTPDIPPGHFAQRKLRFYGLEDNCHLPYIYPKKEYIENGNKLISKYKNPIVFVPDCAKHAHKNRQPENGYFQPLIDELCKNHTILQFGFSNNTTIYNNTIPILDCSLYDLISYYISIKKFIGVDTGDTHLMIALGGDCDIFIPQSYVHRETEHWNYHGYNNIRYYYFN